MHRYVRDKKSHSSDKKKKGKKNKTFLLQFLFVLRCLCVKEESEQIENANFNSKAHDTKSSFGCSSSITSVSVRSGF